MSKEVAMKKYFNRFVSNLVFVLAASLCFACQHTSGPSERQYQEIIKGDVVIVGEKHDNPDHHIFQAKLIERLAKEKRISAVVMEHVYADQEKLFTNGNLDQLEEQLVWKKSGWPDFSMFKPVFQVILANDVVVKAGGIRRDQIKLLYKKKDPKLLSQEQKEALGLSKDLPTAPQKALTKTIVDTHCGYIDEKHASFMVPLQRYKDAFMAQAALDSKKEGKVLVILTGNGHARKDYGIPFYLQTFDPKIKVNSLQLLEEGRGRKLDPTLYDGGVTLKATPYEDPCAKFKKSLQKSFKKKK